MNDNTKKIIELHDGKRTSVEIAELVGLSPRYVRKVAVRYNLPRLGIGARPGRDNHQFVSGRMVDRDGYVLVRADDSHPHARKRTGRDTKIILEHRLVVERKLGRYLSPAEVVDHIDGLTLHNAPVNLRVFPKNGEHLAATISGQTRNWSPQGYQNIGARTDLGAEIQRVDIYHQRKISGDVRLRQILLAALSLGIDSPYLSGTHRHLERAGIDYSSRPSLKRALADLYRKWEEYQTLL